MSTHDRRPPPRAGAPALAVPATALALALALLLPGSLPAQEKGPAPKRIAKKAEREALIEKLDKILDTGDPNFKAALEGIKNPFSPKEKPPPVVVQDTGNEEPAKPKIPDPWTAEEVLAETAKQVGRPKALISSRKRLLLLKVGESSRRWEEGKALPIRDAHGRRYSVDLVKVEEDAYTIAHKGEKLVVSTKVAPTGKNQLRKDAPAGN